MTFLDDNISNSSLTMTFENAQDNMSSFCDFYDTPAAEDSSPSSRVQEKVWAKFKVLSQAGVPKKSPKQMFLEILAK